LRAQQRPAATEALADAATEPAAGARFRRPRHDRPLPDGKLVRGSRNIAAAWLSGPTGRYKHFVLGARHEAESLVVSLVGGRVLRLTLPDDAVFEDREPRLADLDGDGSDEVVLVRSDARQGAAVVVVAVRGDGLAIVAETRPTGSPNTWMNPVAVADLDGDGRPEIALVKMPHVLGELQIWAWRGGRLAEVAHTDDASNHVAGSRHIRLSAVADFDGDGVADIAVPSFDRRALRFLALRRGRLVEWARVALPVPASEDFAVVSQDGRPAVAVGVGAGRRIVVRP
jgi:hypothetical protein